MTLVSRMNVLAEELLIMIEAIPGFGKRECQGEAVDAAERLAMLRFDIEIQTVNNDRLGKGCAEKGLQRTEHQLLLSTFSHPAC